MIELSLPSSVTLFTDSDFGRTLAVKGDGTDHGRGTNHFIVGDAVNGGELFGDFPVSSFGHGQEAGGGRLIPTLSVEQYAAPLGAWFGLSAAEVSAALPNLANFPTTTPAFI